MKKLNNKAFTLVELIVVIAIIGVLTAIIIPTALGYVHNSRLSSINATASALRSSVSNWLLDMDCHGAGMLKSGTVIEVRMICNSNNAIGGSGANMCCVVTNSTIANAYYDGSPDWSFNSDYCNSGTVLENNFEDCIGEAFNGGQFSAVVYIESGTCVGAIVTDNVAGIAVNAPIPLRSDFSVGTFAWSGSDGIGSDGTIYGTAPALYLT